MASSFGGVIFAVESQDGSWFPTFHLDDDGKFIYQCRAFIPTWAHRNALARLITIATWRRPLGTIGVIGHVEAGPGDRLLRVPDAGGRAVNHRAVLTRMSDVQGYAKHADRGFMVDMEFVIISNPVAV